MSGSARGVGPYHISAFGGAYRTCPVCGKKWYVLEVDSWAYVRWTKKDKSGIPTAFCSWSCLRKWDAEHPPTRNFIHPTHRRWDEYSEEDMRKKGNYMRGENHAKSKLTEAEVIAIRKEYAAGGVTQKQLAEKYGVGATRIYMIVNGLSWQHVPMEGT